MIYRPQFAYPAPPAGFVGETFEHYYDQRNVPQFLALNNAGGVTAGQPVNEIPLVLDNDAVFLCRGIKIGNGVTNLGVRIKDPYGNYLSGGFVPVVLSYLGPYTSSTQGGYPVPLESELICEAGSAFQISVVSMNSSPALIPGITLLGVKWYRKEDCQ